MSKPRDDRFGTLYGYGHAVSSGHHLASAAAFSILEDGGNAVDAGCAAGMALAVLYPTEVNFAGVAPIIIRGRPGKVVTIAGLGHFPKSLPADLFMREHGGLMPPGVLRTVVPAAPDAWITALRDHGTMTFRQVANAAIRLARDGIPVIPYLRDQIAVHERAYSAWPSSAAIFLADGRLPQLGSRFVQSDLAATITYMADQESAARGDRAAGLNAARDAFYRGDIAASIVDFNRDQGGYLSREDLAEYRSPYEEPVRVRWRDHELFVCGAWCQGPMLAHALLMMERAGLASVTQPDSAYMHLLLEVLKAAFNAREERFGDPNFVDVGLDELLSEESIARTVRSLNRDVSSTRGAVSPRNTADSSVANPDTSYVCVIDRWGNAFSATPSDRSFTAPVVPGTGLVPSTRGEQARPDPSHPSGVAPGKRPRLTPNPAMCVRDDGSLLAFGSPGGDMQVQAMLQVFLNVLHFGMDVQEAIEAPRISTWSYPGSFSPYERYDNLVAYEDRIPPEDIADLESRGHQLQKWPVYARTAGAVEVIAREGGTCLLRAGADPRRPTGAIVS